MNVFFLDNDPQKIAEYHCDKHVVKMILETAQLLCGAHWVTGSEAPYKLSHKNHPCSIWTRESQSNYLFLTEIGLELCKEYTHRYGKRHKSQDIIEWCVVNKLKIDDIGFTNPPKAMPDEYKVDCFIESYRNYYNGAKADFAKWTKRESPEWFKNEEMMLCN